MENPKPNRSFWTFDVLPIAATVGIDQVSKFLALRQQLPETLGPLTIEVHYNSGVAFGFLSELPPTLKYATLASIGAFVLSAHFFSRFFLHTHSRSLRVGLALQIGGIASNVLDRLLGDGSVVDFISVTIGALRSPVWNLADNIQLIGFALLLIGMFEELKKSWAGVEQRGSTYVNPPFEKKATWIIAFLGIAVGGIMATMSYAFFRAALVGAGVSADQVSSYCSSFLLTVGVLQLGNFLVCLMIGKFLAARIAGPLYALKVYLRAAIEDDDVGEFQLRRDDEFKDLEGPVSELGQRYKNLKRVRPKDEAA